MCRDSLKRRTEVGFPNSSASPHIPSLSPLRPTFSFIQDPDETGAGSRGHSREMDLGNLHATSMMTHHPLDPLVGHLNPISPRLCHFTRHRTHNYNEIGQFAHQGFRPHRSSSVFSYLHLLSIFLCFYSQHTHTASVSTIQMHSPNQMSHSFI